MSFLNWISGDIIGTVGNALDSLFTSDEERLEKENELKLSELLYKLETKRIESDLIQGQLEINKAEAEHTSIFVAGWRPMIGWIGAIALGYQFVLYPLAIWIWAFLQAKAIIPNDLNPPPILDSTALFSIITGMLGIAGLRSYDKVKQTDLKKVGK